MLTDDLDILMGIEPKGSGIILDLCGGTGSWSAPYALKGYDVQVVTWPESDTRLWPSGKSDVPRYQGDFFDVKEYIGKVHGILAAPPCTVFAQVGCKHLRSDEEILQGLSVVDACIRIAYVLQPKWWVLENPNGKIIKWLGPPRHKFHPCDYGDPYTKETFLWGNFNIPEERYVFPTEGSKMHSNIRSQVNRSKTPEGFAIAFCEANP